LSAMDLVLLIRHCNIQTKRIILIYESYIDYPVTFEIEKDLALLYVNI